jgi:hypothetical protein
MGLSVEDIQTGMVLTWRSGMWPHKTSRWIVMEQLEDSAIEGRRFNLYCIQSSTKQDEGVNTIKPHLFRHDQIHRWTINSQI